MKSSRLILLAVAIACIGMLAVGLYLQLVLAMLPCPLCVMQRYAFAALALICLIGTFLPTAARRFASGLACVAAISGAGIAIRHLWVKAHPTVSCGIDPLETALNKNFLANSFPLLFQADGLCTTDYPPIFGLSIPQWALVWFIAFALLTGMLAWRGARNS